MTPLLNEQTVLAIHKGCTKSATHAEIAHRIYDLMLHSGCKFNRFYINKRRVPKADAIACFRSAAAPEIGAAHHVASQGLTISSFVVKPKKLVMLVPGGYLMQRELVKTASTLALDYWGEVYGYCYSLDHRLCPMLYALNLPYFPTPDVAQARFYQSQSRFARWIDHEDSSNIVERAIFRAWHRANFLSSQHLNRLREHVELYSFVMSHSCIAVLQGDPPTHYVETAEDRVQEVNARLEEAGFFDD